MAFCYVKFNHPYVLQIVNVNLKYGYAPAVAESHGAVSVEDGVALHPGGGVAVAAVEEALLRVALLVAVAVAEHVPAALAAPRCHLKIETRINL